MLDVMRNTAFNSLHAVMCKSSLAKEALSLFTLIIVCQNRNGGGYVAKICVNGLNNVTNATFCCTSGSYDLGQTAQIKLPCDSKKLSLTAEEDVFIDSWSVVATQNYNNNTVNACYEMYGTTTNSKWKVVDCP